MRLLPLFLVPLAAFAGEAYHRSGLLFPQEKWHNHSSSLVELPSGELFAVWYHGSGERTADDVIIESARLPFGATEWTRRQTIADTPDFPDCNPAVFLDSRQRLWLIWPVIIANEWHTALLEHRISSDYRDPSHLPRWDVSAPLLFIPRNFAERSVAAIERLRVGAPAALTKHFDQVTERARDKYYSRMGWMPRAHPVQLPSGRIIIPLYSDGYDYSIMAITDDFGKTWTSSAPLVSVGGVQPAIARRRNGTLVAYMRDNGPPPKRMLVSESKDDGMTWSEVRDSTLPNPGSGAEVINLKDGSWALISNDTEKGRHSLEVAISDDEGATWKWRRHLELQAGGQYHYPSLIQARDGTLHATYSYFNGAGKSIKHAHFNIEWVKQGDPR